MSVRANRRRARATPVNVKVAFGNNDDDDEKQNQQELIDEHSTTFSNSIVNKNNRNDGDLERSFQKDMFTINKTTVEVILENDVLSWATVVGDFQDEYSRRKSGNSVSLQSVFAISPIYTHWNWSLNVNENVAGTTISTANKLSSSNGPSASSPLSQTSVLRGFQLHSFQALHDNMLQEILVIFQSDDSNQIEQWFHLIEKIVSEYRPPQHVFVMCNPYAGGRHSRHTYNTKVKTLLERAQYKITYTEIDDQYSADEALQNFEDEFDSIDSLVIIGGDGSVINVVNALIRYLAKENRIRLEMENELPSIPFPICIIPDGTTNIISHTIQGNTDHYTPLLHLLLNQRMKIDMSAIFDVDYNFVTANFGAGAGYPATVLKYFPRYSLHSPKTVIKKSFAKATLNKNLQPFEVEIRYIPASQNDVSSSRCFRGCPTCTPPEGEKSDDLVKAFDDSHIQKLSRQTKSSSSSTTTNGNNHRLSSARKSFNQHNQKEKNWKILHEEFLQVAVFTNASLWSFAPQGLAKFGHLADGLLDLVVIEPVVRKEFLRYIKRNGNSKNQYELPFTRLIKAKEIEIELKSTIDNSLYSISNTDNQPDSSPSDDSSNEDMSDNETKPSSFQKHQPHPPSAPISEDSLRNRQRRRRMNQQSQESSPYILHSSKSMDSTMLQSKPRTSQQQQQSESEMDSPQVDPYGSTHSLRRSGIFQSLKLRRSKILLPRASSVRGRETDDEKQQRNNRKSTGGTLRPARSLLSLFTGGNNSSEKSDKASTFSKRDSFSAGSGRKLSALSRSATTIGSTKKSDRRKKRPCMWNLDFSPYNSPLIRIKCFYRYLSVYGVSLDPDTGIKEVNYSCFGRMG